MKQILLIHHIKSLLLSVLTWSPRPRHRTTLTMRDCSSTEEALSWRLNGSKKRWYAAYALAICFGRVSSFRLILSKTMENWRIADNEANGKCCLDASQLWLASRFWRYQDGSQISERGKFEKTTVASEAASGWHKMVSNRCNNQFLCYH